MIDVLYIAGSGRSGSTLLERILGQIEPCVAIGELKHIWQRNPENELCGCGHLLTECDFWNHVMAEAGVPFDAAGFKAMHELQRSVDRIRYISNMYDRPLTSQAYRSRFETYTGILKRIYIATHDKNNGRIIIDSSKDMSTLYMLLRLPDIRVRVLHLIRDSRAVALSWMREKVRPHAVDYVSMMPTYSPHRSALDWTYRNVMTEFVTRCPTSFHRLRYEDLLADPQTAIANIAKFMDLDKADLSFISSTEIKLGRINHTVAGNPMRFNKGDIRLRLDDAWRHELKQSNKQIVTFLTWPLLRRYGYSLTTESKETAIALE